MYLANGIKLKDFWEKHRDAEEVLKGWQNHVQRANWSNFAEMRADYPAADSVGKYTVFNIKGNNYRLIAQVDYAKQHVAIREIMPHAEYSKNHWKRR
jgi:mRNA interferase HigB